MQRLFQGSLCDILCSGESTGGTIGDGETQLKRPEHSHGDSSMGGPPRTAISIGWSFAVYVVASPLELKKLWIPEVWH